MRDSRAQIPCGAEFFKLSVIRRTLSVRKDEREYVLSIGSFSTVSFGASFYVLHYPKPFALACPAGCQSDVLLLGRSVQGIGVLVTHRVFHMARSEERRVGKECL